MSDDDNDLVSILRDDADIIAKRFKSARVEGKGTSQEIADFREHALQGFLATYYPFPYRVTKGVIRDQTWARSASVDCILLNPVHPHTVDTHGKFRLIFADGVDAAIEVKPDISRKDLVREALEQSASVKALRRVRPVRRVPELHAVETAHASRLPSFVYAMKCKADWLDTADEIIDFYTARSIDRVDQVDAVVVHGCGIFMNYKYPGQFTWRFEGVVDEGETMTPGTHVGWVFEAWGADTLAGLLFHLNNAYPSVTPTAQSVLSHYFRGLKLNIRDVEAELRKRREGHPPSKRGSGGAPAEPSKRRKR